MPTRVLLSYITHEITALIIKFTHGSYMQKKVKHMTPQINSCTEAGNINNTKLQDNSTHKVEIFSFSKVIHFPPA
jgi:N-acetylglucosamine kinase-like BadF-type ATPase